MSTVSKSLALQGHRAALLAAAALVVLSLGALPAMAGHRHDDDDEDSDYSHRHRHSRSCGHDDYGYHDGYDRGHRRERFSVPVVIHRNQVRVYEDYYEGRDWFGPHRHYHQVYYFPVAAGGGYEYRPHYYCGGQLTRQNYVEYDGPRLRVRARF